MYNNQIGGLKEGERVVEQDSKIHGKVVKVTGTSVGADIFMLGDNHKMYQHHSSHYMKEDEYNNAHPEEVQPINFLDNLILIPIGKVFIENKDTGFEKITLDKIHLVEITKSDYAPNGLMLFAKFLYGPYKDRIIIERPINDFISIEYINAYIKTFKQKHLNYIIILLADIIHHNNINQLDFNTYKGIIDLLKQDIKTEL